MKKKLFAALIVFSVLCLSLCAFTFDMNSSVKSLTKPYITTYECTMARHGETNLLEKYEYFKITFLDSKELEVSYKRKGGKRHAHVCAYKFDDKTGVLNAEVGILGFKFKQETKIENGKFTVSMPFFGKPLVLLFQS